MMRTIYLFSNFSFHQHNRVSLWSRKIRKLVWMVLHRLSVGLRAIRRHRYFGRKKVLKCLCFPTIRTDTFTWPIKERCKFVAFRKKTLDILCARLWVWPARRRYVHFFKWHRSMIFRRQSYKSDRRIKRCPWEVSRCCRVAQSAHHRHAFAGTKTECLCKQDNDWLLCRVDHWKSIVSTSDHALMPSWSSSSSQLQSNTNFLVYFFSSSYRFDGLRFGTLHLHRKCWKWRDFVVGIPNGTWCMDCRALQSFFSLLVHRVSKRKTFHFLHYDYEKLFQFILISMCFASQSVSSSLTECVVGISDASHSPSRCISIDA